MNTKTVPGFEKIAGRPPLVVWHTFEATPDGQLAHLIDGVPRATVPPEGWEDYCKAYPEAQDIVDSLTKPTEVKKAEPAVQEAPAEPSVPLSSVKEMIDAAVAAAMQKANQPEQQ